ncbi:hypothetical protein PBCV1_a453R [Paramecium bursaria Chlorella virus 1]|uniref:Uncharacterized protein n=1 Tax=Paramecium bursaria Chlorella virus 1 TaxID=10506 RepID=Q98504_PBCV1|nr:hypothetical protein PBCV1_a453R [Paramecium bursaria Chlorella virus 1]AAC96821.1 hypothetical protein [Paramecium bursaria Chlorella virus 1]
MTIKINYSSNHNLWLPTPRTELQYQVVSEGLVFHLRGILVVLRKDFHPRDLPPLGVVRLENAWVVECGVCCCGFDSSEVDILILRPFRP